MAEHRVEGAPAAAERVDRPVLVDRPEAPVVTHRTVLVERGPFTVAQCSGCGWETFARRSRPLARREGRDH